ncbi:MAG: sigma-70 family RNA polymerase sigma factor [Phycisphaerae bacterium]|nr:sigma-70 family RNA polymerase sigma factor [Phycisphaerae bacterium]
MPTESDQHAESFPTTQWSLVSRAGKQGLTVNSAALNQLLIRYLPALRAHLVVTKRIAPERADDLLQSFVARKFLEENLAAQADRARGKFRTFLLTLLDRFVISEFRRAAAKKRGAERWSNLTLEQLETQAAGDQRPSDAYDVTWARQLLSEAVRRMEAECRSCGRPDIWGVFQCRVLEPTLAGATPLDYSEVVTRFGFRSPSQAANVLITAKRMFERILRAVVAEYAVSEAEVEDEIRDLRVILARFGAGAR